MLIRIIIQIKHHFATTSRPLTKKIMVLVYRRIISVHSTMLAPEYNIFIKPCHFGDGFTIVLN